MRTFITPAIQLLPRRVNRAVKLFLFYTLLTGCWGFLCLDQQAFAQNVQSTHNTADEALKSDLRVDPTTLGLSIVVPFGNYSGRADLSAPVGVRYSSKGLWHMEYSGYYQEGACCAPSFTANPQGLPTDNSYSYVNVSYNATPGSGWVRTSEPPSVVSDFGAGIYNFDGDPCAECEFNQRFYVQSMRVMIPDGSTHELRRSDTVYTSSNRPTDLGAYVAVDGSRLRYVEGPNTTGTLYLPDGSRYLMDNQPNKYIDRNGNTLTYNSDGRWTDTLGRAVGLALTNNPPTPTSDQIYTLTGVGGVSRNYVFRYKYLTEARGVTATNTMGDMNVFGPGFYPGLFHSDGGTRVTPPSQFNPVVLTEIELPDGAKYKFFYNEFGEVDKVVHPTGGYERYLYAVIPGIDPVNEPYAQTNRGVTDRWVSPSGAGGDELHTHYAVSTSPDYKVTITNPDNTYTERRLLRGRGPGMVDFGFDDSRAGMTYDERYYSSAGQMLRRKLSEWSQSGAQSSGSLSSTATRDPRVTKEIEILLDTGGGNALAKTTAYQYDGDLNLISTAEYDFAQVSPATAQSGAISSIAAGALLRTSETTFLVNDAAVDSNTRAAYRARNLTALASSSRVRAAALNIVAQNEIKYDELNYQLAPYGAVTSWTDPATNIRGNATTSRSWLDTPGTWVETHAQYDQCGSVVGSWDANGNKTQSDYSSAYAYAYPTTVTTPAPDPDLISYTSGGTSYSFQPGAFGSTTGLTTHTSYDPSTGRVTSTTDANGKSTTFEYTDPLGRLTKENRPDGGWTSYDYGRNQWGDYVYTRVLLNTSGTTTYAYQYADGLGRTYRSFTYDPTDVNNAWLTSDTQYDSMGRVWKVSNPYRSYGAASSPNPSNRWTTTTYDDLSRVKFVTTPDGAIVTTSYVGNVVTVTDQAGKKRSSVSDALGRLTQVTEDPTAGGLNYLTTYTYDALGNPRKVNQGGQVRFFMYDSLSRLIRAKNPEQAVGSVVSNMTDTVTNNSQWSMAYGYDSNGNMTARVDARNVTTNYVYDHLNRNVITFYTRPTPSDVASTPDVRLYYDNPAVGANGIGRPYWSHAVGVSATAFDSYDAVGRPTQQHQSYWVNDNWGLPFVVARSYDKAGNITSQTYPSGRTVSYTYDAAGRLASFAGNLGDGVQRTYATGLSYSEYGNLSREQFGAQVPLYHKLHYNVRGQLYDIRLSSVNDEWNWNRGMLVNHMGSGDFQTWGTSGPNNNGNVLRSHHYVPNDDQVSGYTVFFQDYEYDQLNRLTKVTETNSVAWTAQYAQKYEYDRFGNRTINAGQTWGAPSTQFELSPATNQEVAEPSNRLYAPGDSGRVPAQKLMRYDLAGNLTYDSYTGQGSRIYDAENRMTQAQDVLQNWSTYTYDASGRRVKRLTANQETWQVYGMGGELLAEYRAESAPMTATKEYGYRGGELLVTMASGDDQRLKRFVTNLYYGALRRDPTPLELQTASNQLAAAGAQSKSQLLGTAKQVARALFTQTSYETLSPARTDSQYISDLYYAYMQRAADDSGLGWWVSQLTSKGRSGVCDDFQNSIEFDALVTTLYGNATSDNQRTEQFVNNLYLGAYGSFATPAQLQQRRDQLNAAAAQGQDSVKSQAEAIGREVFAAQAADLSISAQQFVTNLYEGFLQRGPDAGGLSFWTTQAGTTVQRRQNVLSSFATCPPFRELSGALYRETFWLVSDHLGSPRMVADKSGSLAGVQRHDYLPFGGELLAGTGGRTTTQGYVASDNVRQKFTGKERDGETQLDYFGARYFSSTQGRFTSADDFFKDSQVSDPQSWNKYSYVRNNPLKLVDPTGEKADVTVSVNEDTHTGTITVRATFAVYAARGSRISAKALAKLAERLQKEVAKAWKTSQYERPGVTFDVNIEIGAVAYSSAAAAEAAAAAGKADNLVAIVDAEDITLPNGRHAGGIAGRLAGENFDRVLLSRGAIDGEGFPFAHEFTHLLGARDFNDPRQLTNTYPQQQTETATPKDRDHVFGEMTMITRTVANKPPRWDFNKLGPFSLVFQVRAQDELTKRWLK
jgi:RHS repeat-associated protein